MNILTIKFKHIANSICLLNNIVKQVQLDE